MAVNLSAIISINLDEPVDSDELQAIESNYQQERVAETKKKIIDTHDVKFAIDNKNTQAKIRKKKSRKKKQSVSDENHEKILQNVKVRKYTKEMQNRDAIAKKSRKMRNLAARTESNLDDKFAIAALAPTRKFDDIVYNSMTADDASEILDDVFDDVIEDANQT